MTIKENLIKAIEIVSAYDQNLFNLNTYRFIGDCGTILCSAGLLASHPFFNKQGLTFPPLALAPRKVGESSSMSKGDWTNEMFGTDAYDTLFEQSGFGSWDDQFFKVYPSIPDKQLALARFKRQLQFYQ